MTTLVVGAGVSGLAFANAAKERGHGDDVLVIERETEPGGFCRTIKRDGFVWDYSGHFFHFQRPAIEAWMRERMPAGSVRTIEKRAKCRPAPDDVARETDFPFQTHTHQLPKDEFIACLAGLHRAKGGSATSFKDMLRKRFGDAICDKFLVPYNEKLYATDLDGLDVDAMGRFFPHASLEDALRTMSGDEQRHYNATFTYPSGGAIEYIHALQKDIAAPSLGEGIVSVDVDRRTVTTSKRTIAYDKLITSAPLPAVLAACNVEHDKGAFTANQVLVFNLGFDKKGRDDVHWLYFADPALAFYRVGFYDNILGGDRMSLYVELGMPAGAAVDVEAQRERVLTDLQRAQLVRDHKLVASHHVVMNPAYVHVTKRSIAETTRSRALLAGFGVHTLGRYGGWTYCSIEDNIVEARALAAALW